MKTRKILHFDLDAFFCAVEEHRDPSLRGKAFAVGGSPDVRGVVASCSYPAREYGVRSAMPMSQAIRLCPHLIVVSRNYGEYERVSREVMAVLEDLTPLVEKLSIDEAFLDVTALEGEAESIARRLQTKINNELDLPCSLGVATNKLIAKIANNIGKASIRDYSKPPNHIEVVLPNREAEFLFPLPVRELWGVGPKTAEKLSNLGIETIGQIAKWSEKDLVARFGKLGRDLYQHANGIDHRLVSTHRETKSISRETTFSWDIRDVDKLKDTLRQLSDNLGRRVRKSKLQGTTISIKLRWADFTTLTRQTTLHHATNQDAIIYDIVEKLLLEHWQGQAVRLIGVGMSGFEDSKRQLSFWDDPEAIQQEKQLQNTLDELKDRFGDRSIKRASDLKRKR